MGKISMPKAFPKPVAILFFLIGLISALCFRVIIIVQHANPSLVRIFWYTAVLTNMIFFLYRYHISLKRKKAVIDYDLLSKVKNDQKLNAEEKHAIHFLLTSIDRSKENLNYLCLFILSTIAILVDIFLSFY